MKKIICCALCLLLMLSLVACGDEVQTKTVSLLVTETRYSEDGSLYGEYTYAYDDRGNLLRAEYPGDPYSSAYSYTYDDYGYLTECTWTYELVPGQEGSSTEQYLYTLKNGLPKSCQVISDGKEQYICHFKTNKKGLITRVDYEYASDAFSQQAIWRWAAFEYDRDGRLLQESFCRSQPLGYSGSSDIPAIMYSLWQYRYEYNRDGTLKSLDFEFGGSSEDGKEIRDPSEVTFEQQHHWDFIRNDQDQLTQIIIDGDPHEFTVTDSGVSIPEQYSDEWELNQMGNVVSAGNDTYVYETVELSVQDADRYNRWNILLRSKNSYPTHLSWLRLQCLPIYHNSYELFFYYYLIPNPLA